MTKQPVIVLYAEDSENDAFLMQRAFSKVNFRGSLVVVPDGLDVTKYLGGEGRYANRGDNPLPSLILLDVKMPCVGGLQALEWIRTRREFDDTPVLMLTSSNRQSDVEASYKAGADAYLVKPANFDDLRELAEDLVGICAAPDHSTGVVNVRGVVPPPEPSR